MNIAQEPPSTLLPPMTNKAAYRWVDGVVGFTADVGPYQVAVRFDWVAEKRVGLALLQVARADGGSVFDWRDLQQIKNHVLGDDWEAVELYPAEARLKDPSNARYLWAAKDGFPFGLPGGRRVLDAADSIAPQRPLPKGAPDA